MLGKTARAGQTHVNTVYHCCMWRFCRRLAHLLARLPREPIPNEMRNIIRHYFFFIYRYQFPCVCRSRHPPRSRAMHHPIGPSLILSDRLAGSHRSRRFRPRGTLCHRQSGRSRAFVTTPSTPEESRFHATAIYASIFICVAPAQRLRPPPAS